jgi:hypothetical protein
VASIQGGEEKWRGRRNLECIYHPACKQVTYLEEKRKEEKALAAYYIINKQFSTFGDCKFDFLMQAQ